MGCHEPAECPELLALPHSMLKRLTTAVQHAIYLSCCSVKPQRQCLRLAAGQNGLQGAMVHAVLCSGQHITPSVQPASWQMGDDRRLCVPAVAVQAALHPHMSITTPADGGRVMLQWVCKTFI